MDHFRMRFRSALFSFVLSVSAAMWPGASDARNAYTPDTPAPSAQTCARDTLVWVNTKSGIYHLPGMRWYGRTQEGEYMCKKAAEQAGHRPTHNGQ
jgi:hypothetical protein